MSFSQWELIDDGSFNGVRRYIRSSDEDEGTVQVRTEDHAAPLILERNKAAQNDWDGVKGDLIHAATIPVSVMLQWYLEDGIWATSDMDYLCRKLNDPDWRYLKRIPIEL